MSLIKTIKQKQADGTWQELSLHSNALDNVVTLDGEQTISGDKTWSGRNLFQGSSGENGLTGTQVGIDGITIKNTDGLVSLNPLSLNLNGTKYTSNSIKMANDTKTLTIPEVSGTLATQGWVEGIITGKVDYLGVITLLSEIDTTKTITEGDFYRVGGDGFEFGSEYAHAGDILIAAKDDPTQNTSDWDLIHNEYDWTHTHNYTPAGTVSKPTFTGKAHKHTASFSGDTKTTSVKYTPGGSVSQPTFTGNAHKHTASFQGTEQTASIDYTPAGSVSQPTFTGNAHNHTASFIGTQQTVSVDYTPAGKISKPSITVTPSTESIGTITGIGSLPTLTATYDSSNKRVTFSWSAGTLPTKTNKDVMTSATAALNATPTFTGTKASISHTLTPSGSVSIENTTAGGTVSQSTFSGSKATISHTFTPAGSVAIENTTATGSVSKPIFTGTESDITHSYTPSGTVTIKNTTATGDVSQPTFSGNQGTTSNPN